jgi:hypothetical protein
MASAYKFKDPAGDPSQLMISLTTLYRVRNATLIMLAIHSEAALSIFDWTADHEHCDNNGELKPAAAKALYDSVLLGVEFTVPEEPSVFIIKPNGARNRRAGHAFELVSAKQLVSVFPHIASSRSCNRKRDDAGVDLVNSDEYENGRLPYNFQCKSQAQGVNYHSLLKSMPKESGIMNVVFHRFTEKKETMSGDVFIIKGEFGLLRMVDLIELIRASELLKAVLKHNVELPTELVEAVDFELATIIAQTK